MRTRPEASLLLCLISACTTSPRVVLIPIQFSDGNAIATAVAGGNEIEVIVDTGGFGGIAISPRDLAISEVVFTGSTIERTDAAGDRFLSRQFVVPRLRLGNAVFRSVPGYERLSSASGIAGGEPINIIGRAFLGQYTVVVDYPNASIELHGLDRGPEVCGAPTAQLARNDEDLFIIDVRTDAGVLTALLDTGATYSFIQQHVVTARGLPVVDDAYTTQTMKIGDDDFGPLELVALQIDGVSTDVLLGTNFFEKHRVCFDYKNWGVTIN